MQSPTSKELADRITLNLMNLTIKSIRYQQLNYPLVENNNYKSWLNSCPIVCRSHQSRGETVAPCLSCIDSEGQLPASP